MALLIILLERKNEMIKNLSMISQHREQLQTQQIENQMQIKQLAMGEQDEDQ